MELAASLSNVYQMETRLAKKCLKGDVLDELMTAANHMANVSYMGGRLVTNGVDILDEVSSGFTSYEHRNYRAFGKDLGTAWRTVLLSKHNSQDNYANPSPLSVQEATEGLFASFFGPGFKL